MEVWDSGEEGRSGLQQRKWSFGSGKAKNQGGRLALLVFEELPKSNQEGKGYTEVERLCFCVCAIVWVHTEAVGVVWSGV